MLRVNSCGISRILFTDLVNHMLPNISELVLREWFAEKLHCSKLKKENEAKSKEVCAHQQLKWIENTLCLLS